MKLRYKIILLMVSISISFAMEKPPQEPRKRPGEELPEQRPAKIQAVGTQQEGRAFEALPNELKDAILKYLITTAGSTADIRLAKAADNIRAFMALGLKNSAFRPFLEDENLHGYLITELANRYAGGNIIKAALALRTDAGGKWLRDKNFSINQFLAWILLAVQEKNNDLLAYLIKYTPLADDFDVPLDQDENSLFILAAQSNNSSLIDYLWKNFEIDINKQNKEGWTALMVAAKNGNIVIVQQLLEMPGIDVTLESEEDAEKSAIEIAAQYGHTAIVDLLLQDPNILFNNINKALVFAATNNHLATMNRLLQVPGIDVNEKVNGTNALLTAVSKGNIEMVNLLLAMPGINVNVQERGVGATPLIMAIGNKNGAIAEKLLTMPGIDLNVIDQRGLNALIWAIHDNAPIIDALLKKLSPAEKNRAFSIAVNFGHLPTIEILLKQPDVNVNIPDHRGWTPLLITADKGQLDIVNALLKAPGIDVNRLTNRGATALMLAAQNGHVPVVDRLLQVPDINVNIQDTTNGGTALIYSITRHQLGSVKRLLADPRTNVNLRAANGATALEYAKIFSDENQRNILIKLLQERGATE